jgi:hypothetical protein
LVAESPTREGEELLDYLFETTLAYTSEDRDDLTALVIQSLD